MVRYHITDKNTTAITNTTFSISTASRYFPPLVLEEIL